MSDCLEDDDIPYEFDCDICKKHQIFSDVCDFRYEGNYITDLDGTTGKGICSQCCYHIKKIVWGEHLQQMHDRLNAVEKSLQGHAQGVQRIFERVDKIDPLLLKRLDEFNYSKMKEQIIEFDAMVSQARLLSRESDVFKGIIKMTEKMQHDFSAIIYDLKRLNECHDD